MARIGRMSKKKEKSGEKKKEESFVGQLRMVCKEMDPELEEYAVQAASQVNALCARAPPARGERCDASRRYTPPSNGAVSGSIESAVGGQQTGVAGVQRLGASRRSGVKGTAGGLPITPLRASIKRRTLS